MSRLANIIHNASKQLRGEGYSYAAWWRAKEAAQEIDREYAIYIAKHYSRKWPKFTHSTLTKGVIGWWDPEKPPWKDANGRWWRAASWASYVVYPYSPPVEQVAQLGYN